MKKHFILYLLTAVFCILMLVGCSISGSSTIGESTKAVPVSEETVPTESTTTVPASEETVPTESTVPIDIGKETGLDVIAQQVGLDHVASVLARPQEEMWSALDGVLHSTEVFDAYWGEDGAANFCFYLVEYLKIDEAKLNGWLAGSGPYLIEDGEYAGWYEWQREALAMQKEDGSWELVELGTAGMYVYTPVSTISGHWGAGFTSRELLDVYFVTLGRTHDFHIPRALMRRPFEEFKAVFDTLTPEEQQDVKTCLLAQGKYDDPDAQWFADDLK